MGQAYEKLRFDQNICEIRRIIYKITEQFPKGLYKPVSQMRDAARSAQQNIRYLDALNRMSRAGTWKSRFRK